MLEGNTFFIVEVVRALAEEVGSLELIGTRELPRQVFAGGVQTVVARRLSRAPEGARPLLKLAAVAGRKLDRRVLGLCEPELLHWLQVLTDAAILEATEAEWRFCHDKLRERLLESLTEDERRRLHRQIGEAMEAVYGRSGAPASTLGYHFEQAGELGKAGAYLAQAGAGALRRGAVREAAALLQRANRLQEQTAAPALARATTLRRLSKAAYALGRHAECLELAQRAMTLLGRPIPETPARRLGAILRETAKEAAHRLTGRPLGARLPPAAAQEFLTLSRGTSDAYFVVKGRLDEAFYVMLGALHAAESIDAVVEQVNYLMYIGLLAYSLPLHRLGRYYVRLSQQLLPRVPDDSLLGGYYALASYIHSAEGQWEACLDALARWLHSVERIGDEGQQALVHRTRAGTWMALGRLDALWEDGAAELRLGRRLDNETMVASGLFYHALVLYHRGELVRAQALLTESMQRIEGGGSALLRLMASSMQAAVGCRAGELGPAQRSLALALALLARVQPPTMHYLEGYAATLEAALSLRQAAGAAAECARTERQLRRALWHLGFFAMKFPVGRPRLLIGLGRYLWLHDRPQPALRSLYRGLAEAARLRMPAEQARAHLWLGRLGGSVAAAGLMQAAAARRHLEQAAEQFTALQMSYEGAQAAQAL